MTSDKWLQGKYAKCVPLLFTACHRLVQYKKKMNASSNSRLSLLIKRSCSLPISMMIGFDRYNSSMMFWLFDEFMETEQGRWSPTHGFPCKVIPQ